MGYMGGDGPHYSPATGPLHRNTSFGLATLRPDGFVGVRQVSAEEGSAQTMPLLVTGRRLTLTADAAPAGSVSVTVRAANTNSLAFLECDPVIAENVTDSPLTSCDLQGMWARRRFWSSSSQAVPQFTPSDSWMNLTW